MDNIQRRVLVIDPDPDAGKAIQSLLGTHVIVDSLTSLDDGKTQIEPSQLRNGLIIVSFDLPGWSDTVRKLSEKAEIPIVVLGNTLKPEQFKVLSAQAKCLGVADFLQKPYNKDQLQELLEIGTPKISEDTIKSVKRILVGESPSIRQLRNTLFNIAQGSHLLITGESGSGKGQIVKAIAEITGKRVVRVDLATLAGNLIASELFGHVKGAFTGAFKNKKGIFEMAEGCILFLNEIGNIDKETQKKLLGFLQDKIICKVGDTTEITVNCWVILDTNVDLEEAVSEGGFREDLFHRINALRIHIPPLRERGNDCVLLAEHFIHEHNTESAKKKELTKEAKEWLRGQRLPGNVRELKNIIDRGISNSLTKFITAYHLEPRSEISSTNFRTDEHSGSAISPADPSSAIPLAEPEEKNASTQEQDFGSPSFNITLESDWVEHGLKVAETMANLEVDYRFFMFCVENHKSLSQIAELAKMEAKQVRTRWMELTESGRYPNLLTLEQLESRYRRKKRS